MEHNKQRNKQGGVLGASLSLRWSLTVLLGGWLIPSAWLADEAVGAAGSGPASFLSRCPTSFRPRQKRGRIPRCRHPTSRSGLKT